MALDSTASKGATWTVVADAARARILIGDPGGELLRVLVEVSNPQGRMRDRELVSDANGRSRAPDGQGQAMGPGVSPSEHVAELFARQVAHSIETARRAGQIGCLYLVAEPRFLGLLRKNLSAPAQKLVAGELDKDYTQGPVQQIQAALRALAECVEA